MSENNTHKPTANPFNAFKGNISGKPRLFTIVTGIDEDPDAKNPAPIKPNDENSVTLEVYPMSAKTRTIIDDMEGSVQPPTKPVKRPSLTDPTKTIDDFDYDFEDPKYLAQMKSVYGRQQLAAVLLCCPTLHETTEGSSLEQKIDSLAEVMPSGALDSLLEEIQSFVFAVGQTADFFTQDASANSKSSQRGGSNRKPKAKSAKSSGSSTAKTANTKS